MNIAVLCNGAVLMPAMEALLSQGLLAGVALPEAPPSADPNLGLEAMLGQAGIPVLRLRAGALTGQMAPWLEGLGADLVCCMGFPRKLPEALLGLPRFGCFNLHAGALPAYRGPDPVFWQIKHLEPHVRLTIHRMTPELDTGAIVHSERVAIAPDDTHALVMQRLGGVLPRLLIEFVQQVALHGEQLPLQEQAAEGARWLPRPSDADRTLNWNWSAREIDALVRACNPGYGGAHTLLKGVPVRILEVAEAQVQPQSSTPGSIVAADSGGLRVACGQGESLLLEILFGMDGFFSGRRLARIFGVRAGDRMG